MAPSRMAAPAPTMAATMAAPEPEEDPDPAPTMAATMAAPTAMEAAPTMEAAAEEPAEE